MDVKPLTNVQVLKFIGLFNGGFGGEFEGEFEGEFGGKFFFGSRKGLEGVFHFRIELAI